MKWVLVLILYAVNSTGPASAPVITTTQIDFSSQSTCDAALKNFVDNHNAILQRASEALKKSQYPAEAVGPIVSVEWSACLKR